MRGGPKEDPVLANFRDPRRAFGYDLRAARARAGLTQAALARLTGVDEKHISRIEHGKVNVTLDTMAMLAQAVGFELRVSLTPAPPEEG